MKNTATKLMRSFTKIEAQTLSCTLFAGCFLISMAFLVVSASYVVSFASLSSWLSINHGVGSDPKVEPKFLHKQSDIHRKPLCDTSDRISDICDIEGDVRAQGISSSIVDVNFADKNTTLQQDSWKIKPHPRKGDIAGMFKVTELSVKSLKSYQELPKCDVNHTVPAIIFSTGGYMGNFFHDFNDLIISLYLTAEQFNGEVQFLIREMLPWWNTKYADILKQLSHYEIIDFNQDRLVHCYPRVIVGVKSRGRGILTIDPAKSNGRTMVDFGKFIKRAYALERDTSIKLRPDGDQKPRLLLIARNSTRKFTNIQEIAGMAGAIGFEIVVIDIQANSSLSEIAKTVNSCDVILGVHGAGLTNLFFLPTNAVVIQVCPLGGLETICWSHFGQVALELNMRYLQYNINFAESSLILEYPLNSSDSAIVMDPKSILNQKDGWQNWTILYFFKQNVKLDIDRFTSVLLQAKEILRH